MPIDWTACRTTPDCTSVTAASTKIESLRSTNAPETTVPAPTRRAASRGDSVPVLTLGDPSAVRESMTSAMPFRLSSVAIADAAALPSASEFVLPVSLRN